MKYQPKNYEEGQDLQNALDLINRLQAENKRLSTLAELGNKRADDYRVMRDRALKAEKEVERLKKDSKDIDEFARNICKERLLRGVAIADFDSLRRYIKMQKAEAYKEFADKVGEEITKIRRNAPNRHITVIVETLLCLQQRINNLFKEMVGEDNG